MTATPEVDLERSSSFNVKRIVVKFFVREPEQVDRTAFIPIFHRWIQQSLFDRLLVDVADYRHVHHGPGVVLIGHEGQYRMDEGGGRLGLQYEQTRWNGNDVRERLRDVFDAALTACNELEKDERLTGTLRFQTNEIIVNLRDSLLVPNTEVTLETWRPVLETLLADLYEGAAFRIARDTQSATFAVRIAVNDSPEVATLVKRLRRAGTVRDQGPRTAEPHLALATGADK